MRSYTKILLGLTVSLIFILYFLNNLDSFKILLTVNTSFLVLIALGNMLVIAANGLFMKFILEPFNKHISLSEGVFVSLISSVGNFFAPAGSGFGFRAVYLKKKHKLSYTDYLTTLSGNYIIVFLVSSFFGLLSLFLLRERAGVNYALLVIIFSTLFVTTLALSLIKIPINYNKSFTIGIVQNLYNTVLKITQGWSGIVSNRKLTLRLTLITIFNFTITVTLTYLVIKSLQYDIGFAELLLFSVLGLLSLFVNLTPANLGVKEAIYIFSSTVLGFSVEQILLISLIDRGVLFLVLITLWLITSNSKMKKQYTTK